MSSTDQIVLIEGARTPVGGFMGSLKDVPAYTRQPPVRIGLAGDLVSGDAAALGRPRHRAGWWRRVDEPDAVLRLRSAQQRRLGDQTLVDGTVMMLTDPFGGVHMGVTAENVAEKYGVSRREQDEFALESQHKAASAAAMSIGGGQALAALFRRAA